VSPDGAILLVDSDGDRVRPLHKQLLADGFPVRCARSAEHARVLAEGSRPRLAVLGALEEPRGVLALLEEIRGSTSAETRWEADLPVIVVGSEGGELDLLRAFDAGADDVLAREASYLELRCRVRAVLRRAERAVPVDRVEVHELSVDLRAHAATVGGRSMALRRMEFELLAHLARDPQRVCSRRELLDVVWGYRDGVSTRTIDSHASRLRRKLELDGGRRWVINVWGVGYRLC
jgi:DNA-binding response OmpR family regulator